VLVTSFACRVRRTQFEFLHFRAVLCILAVVELLQSLLSYRMIAVQAFRRRTNRTDPDGVKSFDGVFEDRLPPLDDTSYALAV
jgi:hypothetical protein